MSWNFTDKSPVYLQIADRIRSDILNGTYPPDTQIPAVRQLAITAAVNPNTVQRAMSELEAEGFLCSKGTQGRFVTSDPEILSEGRKKSAEKLVRQFVRQAKSMSISKDELINLIKEETDE